MSLTEQQLARFAAELAADRDNWERFIRHERDARVYEQIWDDEDVNAWVICWSEEQDTGYHDHDDSAAAIAIIEGQVREDRLRLGAADDSRVVGAGSTLLVPPTAIHRVLHAGSVPAITIHAYSPPLRRVGAYSIGPSGALQRASLTYDEELRAEPALS